MTITTVLARVPTRSALMLLSLVPGVHSVAPAQSRGDAVLTVDVNAIESDAARSALIAALAQLTSIADWPEVTVPEGANLYTLIAREYRFADRVYPLTARALADLIAVRNGLSSIDTIAAGLSLRFPVLQQRPFSFGASPTETQLLRIDSVGASPQVLRTTMDAASMVFREAGEAVEPTTGQTERAKNWSTVMSVEQALALLRSLPDSILAALEDNLSFVTDLVVPAKLPQPAFEQGTVDFPPLPRLQDIAANTASKRLYVIDVFRPTGADACQHGDKVRDVVELTLAGIGWPELTSAIRPVEIDFFHNVQASSRIVEEHARLFEDKPVVLAALDRIRKNGRPHGGGLYIPVLYLQAIYSTLLRSDSASVISSSVYAQFDGFQALTGALRSDMEALLVSAVLDEADSYIEDVTYIEPLKSFYDGLQRYGVVLVGAEMAPGVAYGMRSRVGDGVSVLGPGRGWTGKCVSRNDLGTSFSAPFIAAYLFAAREYWNSQQLQVSAVEARTRLLLSADIRPEHLGYYASVGTPNINKLLRGNKPFVVGRRGDIREVDGIAGKVRFTHSPSSTDTTELPLRKGKLGVRGLQRAADNNWYMFSEAEQQWIRMHPIEIIAVLTTSGSSEHVDLLASTSPYSEVIIP